MGWQEGRRAWVAQFHLGYGCEISVHVFFQETYLSLEYLRKGGWFNVNRACFIVVILALFKLWHSHMVIFCLASSFLVLYMIIVLQDTFKCFVKFYLTSWIIFLVTVAHRLAS